MSAPGSSSESTLASQSSASAPAPKMDAAAADKEVANRDMAFDRVDRDERDNEALEREAREVERKLAFWGADAPPQRPARRRASSMPRRPALGVLHAATTGGPAMRPGATSETGAITARGARATRRRALSGTSERPSFPELHLVDSAYDREVQLLRDRGFNVPAQRMRSRSMSMKSTGRKTFDERTMDERTVVEEPEEEEEQDAQREDPNRVQWPPGDPANPQNWPTWRKWSVTVLCGLLTINVTFASSAPASAIPDIAAEFGTVNEVGYLITSLFLLGFVAGPLFWAPLSEMFGRRPVFVATTLVYTLFQLGCALAPNMQTLLVSRFLGGTFAAAPITNSGGVVADVWDPVGRGYAMSVFASCVFIGPVIGPIIGGFVGESYLGWRWIMWCIMIWGALSFVLCTLFLPETFSPVLLTKRAKRMRKEEPEVHADKFADLERADFSFRGILERTIARPFAMLAKEPIIALVTVYLSVVYALLYSLFSVFPVIWTRGYGFSAGLTGLVFIGVGIGTTLGAIINILLQRKYRKLVPHWHGHPPPEHRLTGAMLAGPFLVTGILWLGWTGAYPESIPWFVPAIATILVGISFTLIFVSFLSYLIDAYLMYAASALAANTIVRSALGAAMPLFTTQWFTQLGVNWSCLIIGLVCVLLCPIPVLFYYYGPRIRQSSTFAPCLDLHMAELLKKEEEGQKASQGEKTSQQV